MGAEASSSDWPIVSGEERMCDASENVADAVKDRRGCVGLRFVEGDFTADAYEVFLRMSSLYLLMRAMDARSAGD